MENFMSYLILMHIIHTESVPTWFPAIATTKEISGDTNYSYIVGFQSFVNIAPNESRS